MAQVPYTGVPQVEPSPRGLEVAVPPDAFGVGVAQAVEGLGKDIGQAGNELWDRAVALKQLQNETEAKDADINFMMEVGEKHAAFNAKEGQDRVAAFPAYSKDLQDTYRRYRAGLSNDYARRMFDSTAVSTMSRSIFNGAGAAATAQKEWSHASTLAGMDLDAKRAFEDPTNQAEIDDRIKSIRPNARQLAATSPGGYDPKIEEDIVMKQESRIRRAQVEGIAQANPLGAAEILDRDRKRFTEADWDAANNKVRGQARSVGSDNIALNVLDKHRTEGGYDTTREAMIDEARKTAEQIWGKRDPEMPKYAVAQLEHHWEQDNVGKRLDRQNTDLEIDDWVLKGAKSISELPPDLRRKMDAKQLLIARGKINNFQSSSWKTDSLDEEYRLRGLYANPATRAQFMDENIVGNDKLSRSQIGFFAKLQRDPIGDPRVPRAIKWLQNSSRGAEMQALNVFSRDKAKPDDFDRLVGSLHEAIQAYQETHGKPPDEKAVTDEIWPAVRATVKTPGTLWGTNETPFFLSTVPPDARKAIDEDRVSSGRKPADENDYIHDYNRMMFIKHFGPKETP